MTAKKINFKKFEVLTVPLTGSNLIEASAGTGKTYSIAILSLRLILEKKIPINEILMVTFTNAAVAELQERVRFFIREAYKYVNGQDIGDAQIKSVVDASKSQLTHEEAQLLLRRALLNIDETAIMTIHGFCQKSLHEFAFETNQLFNAELIQDVTEIITKEIQQFWRSHITVLEDEYLKILTACGFNHATIFAVLKDHLNEKNYLFYDFERRYDLKTDLEKNTGESYKTLQAQAETCKEQLIQKIIDERTHIENQCYKNRYAQSLVTTLDDPEKFIAIIYERKTKKYIKDLFPEYLKEILRYYELCEAILVQEEKTINDVYSFAIQEISEQIEKHKRALNLMSFDDMIVRMHDALTKNKNTSLAEELRKKYKAVFIDEFQDTDKKQYEIFKNAFQDNSILFYIGDPKQSIYAFRKADIATYFEARNRVDNVYEMNINYRSTPSLITALNHFFLPHETFDTFHYEDDNQNITYTNVDAPANDSKGNILYKNNPITPIQLTKLNKKDEIASDLTYQILNLLTDSNFTIPDKKLGNRPIRPSDIGVLVRSNRDGLKIQQQLSHVNIPTVIFSDIKILQTNEAQEIAYLLDAIIQHKRAQVNRVLLTKMFGWKKEDILQADDEHLIEMFRNYYSMWLEKGIYATLMTVISDFRIRTALTSDDEENGMRILTNLTHLMELLYKTESRQHLNPVELLQWLRLNIANPESEDDEWIQRMETDEEAVKIVTIHKSKGLQYPIVFAPYLDFALRVENSSIVNFRDKNGDYRSGKLTQLDDSQRQLYLNQSEQENRRLLYVTLTRAVYACFIYKNNYYTKSTLSEFVNAITVDGVYIGENEPLEKPTTHYVPEAPKKQNHPKITNFILRENYWARMSYSSLAAKPEFIPRANYSSETQDYDYFIFKSLGKGSKIGNFLHTLFENISFDTTQNQQRTIQRIINQFIQKKEQSFEENIHQLLEHTLQVKIQTDAESFSLSEVNPQTLIHELEFDFPVARFTPALLQNLQQQGITISHETWKQLEGMMTGKIDLFFKHNGKYYLLDWKSNYLGATLEDYSQTALSEVMRVNNYHLQYYIYTYAVRKFLVSRLDNDFDYERDFGGVLYLFIRGIRRDKTHGIFYAKPTLKQLKLMEKLFEESVNTL